MAIFEAVFEINKTGLCWLIQREEISGPPDASFDNKMALLIDLLNIHAEAESYRRNGTHLIHARIPEHQLRNVTFTRMELGCSPAIQEGSVSQRLRSIIPEMPVVQAQDEQGYSL